MFDWACDVPGEPVWCHDFFGRPLRELHSLPPIMLVTPQGDDVLFPHIALESGMVEGLRFDSNEEGLVVTITCDAATDWWLRWPQHLLTALGWESSMDAFPPPPGASFCIRLAHHPLIATRRITALVSYIPLPLPGRAGQGRNATGTTA